MLHTLFRQLSHRPGRARRHVFPRPGLRSLPRLVRLEDRVTPNGSFIHPAGPEFRANTYNTGPQAGAAVAALAGGEFVVTWEIAGQDSSGSGVYDQQYELSQRPNLVGVVQVNGRRAQRSRMTTLTLTFDPVPDAARLTQPRGLHPHPPGRRGGRWHHDRRPHRRRPPDQGPTGFSRANTDFGVTIHTERVTYGPSPRVSSRQSMTAVFSRAPTAVAPAKCEQGTARRIQSLN